MNNYEATPLAFEELLSRCMGELDFAQSILENFLTTCDQQIDEMEQLVDPGSSEDLARLAHRFKGTAATVAARPLTSMLEDLEKMAKDQMKTGDPLKEPICQKLEEAKHEIVRLRDYAATELFC